MADVVLFCSDRPLSFMPISDYWVRAMADGEFLKPSVDESPSDLMIRLLIPLPSSEVMPG
jgi:hypothetical protein